MTMATIGYMGPEYGIDGIVSTKGDVYSFGILTMETITGKKPTNEVFGGERSLKSWVEESISSPLNQVVDTNLLSTVGRERLAASNCAISILRVGLECSAESPAERPDMKEICVPMVLGLRDQTEWEGPGVSLRPLDQGVGCSVVGLQIRAVGSIRESLLSEPFVMPSPI
ncbi:hypothetical protein V6N12_009532 [Hibiscus sabdariffa]|uniref:Protein kinase domain-containing protein n=1 Tax=Hibiscus sabdariffa TaxID=183260 RepID=A0ABR1ZLV7_9ROSI